MVFLCCNALEACCLNVLSVESTPFHLDMTIVRSWKSTQCTNAGQHAFCIEKPWPTQRFKSPVPEIPRIKLKNSSGPDPNSLKKTSGIVLKTEIFAMLLFCILVFFEFSSKNLGSGLEELFFIFFWGGGSGLLIPCSWPGVSQILQLQLSANTKTERAC